MRSFIVMACLAGALLMVGPQAAQSQEPSPGFALWVHSPVGFLQNAFSSIGAPQFNAGFRGNNFGLGLGLGFTVLRSTEENFFNAQLENKATFSATLFQIGPSGWVDVWHSPDGRARGNIVAGMSIGRLSGTDKNEFRSFNGAFETSESSVSATLLGFHLGVGGEHFLPRTSRWGWKADFRETLRLISRKKWAMITWASGPSASMGRCGQ